MSAIINFDFQYKLSVHLKCYILIQSKPYLNGTSGCGDRNILGSSKIAISSFQFIDIIKVKHFQIEKETYKARQEGRVG